MQVYLSSSPLAGGWSHQQHGGLLSLCLLTSSPVHSHVEGKWKWSIVHWLAMKAMYSTHKARPCCHLCPPLHNQGIDLHTLIWEESWATGGGVVLCPHVPAVGHVSFVFSSDPGCVGWVVTDCCALSPLSEQ